MSSLSPNWFPASPDSASKIVTGVALFGLFVIAIAANSLTAAGLTILLLVAAYAWSPSGYSISEGAVIVRRLIGNVRIALDDIRDVRVVAYEEFPGSRGLFGYYGASWTSTLGKSRWYATNRSRSLVLTSTSGAVVISPDDANGFMAAIRTTSPSIK